MTPPPAPDFSPRLHRDVWAGCATAAIFYVEYLGLGSLLGEALRPGMPDGAALGMMLVLVPVIACSLLALASHGVALAGPRAASMVVVTRFLPMMAAAYPTLQGGKAGLLAVMTASAALTLLAGRLPMMRRVMDRAPIWLVQGFMFATALGIVAGGAAAGRLLSCLQVDALAAWFAYLPPVVLGIVWKTLLVRVLEHARRRRSPKRLLAFLAWLQPLGLVAAVAVSWSIFEQSQLAVPNGRLCGRFGTMEMDWSLLASRWESVSRGAVALPLGAALAAALAGVLVGAVLVLESLTAFTLNRRLPAYANAQPRMLAATAVGSLLSAAVAGAPAAFSTSRTVVLRALGGRGRFAVPVHGLALLGIALLASPCIAQVPKLSAAVALTLVGVQMLGRETERLWQRGYRPGALPVRQGMVVLFWLVLALGLLTNNALVGFIAMAIAACLFTVARNQWRHRGPSVVV